MRRPAPEPTPQPPLSRAPRRARVALVATLAAAAALRAWPAPDVFTPGGVRLVGDDDPAYHVLQAERILAGAPGAPWRDPGLNHPHGAAVPWPPLFDGLVAAAARLTAPPGPVPREHVAAVASVLPVVLALLTIPVIAALAELLAGAGAGLAAALVALLPAHAVFSTVGRADQHVLELLLASLAFLAIARGLREPSGAPWRSRALLAVALAAAFWTWTGSALYVLLLVAFVGAQFVIAPAGAPVARRSATDLAAGAGGAALLVAASAAATRGPAALRELALSGITGFPVLQLAMTAAFAAALALAARRPVLAATWPRRVAVAACAAALPLAIALSVPAVREAVWRGLTPLARANAWYRNVQEFDPLLFAGWAPLGAELSELVGLYGLTLLAMPLAAVPLVRRLVRGGEPRAPLAFLLAWGAVFLALGLARQRFALYLVAPLAIWVGAGWRGVVARVAGRHGARAGLVAGVAAGALLVGPALAAVPATLAGETAEHAAARELLERVPTLPAVPGRPAVYSQWNRGHLVQYAARRPTLVSPFGTEGGDGAMEDAAAFFFATDPAEAEALLARREIGLLLVENPVTEAYFGHAFAPAGTPPLVGVERSARTGVRVAARPGLGAILPARLYHEDGGAAGGREALAGFRLVDESGVAPGGRPRFKLFGWVPGARVRVRGAPAGDAVEATVQVAIDGRRFAWRASARADAAGEAVLRVPYATGPNGRAEASPLVVTAGPRGAIVTVPEAAVIAGSAIDAPLR